MNLSLFNTTTLFEAATNLFQQLGIKLNSNTAEALPTKDLLKNFYKDNEVFNSIKSTYFIGIIDDSVFQATGMFDVNYSINKALLQGDKNYDGLMLFALELTKKPTRTEISEITRAFNRISQKMPVALVLKYAIEKEAVISIAISERFKYLQKWRQGEKAGKVIILRDIHTKPENTHAGHQRILLDLVKPTGVTNYAQLHAQWLEVLDVNILNKKFFQELANWYFWAMDKVQFPDDIEKKKDVRNATNLIRLITRVIFIWFIKEKHLVPASLFNEKYLSTILKDFQKNKKSANYYQAILQNLFFGTLNQKMDERDFAEDHNRTNKLDQGIKNKYRYPDKFNISKKEVIALFKDIPFLNGGLFDCLDKFDEEKLEKGKKEQIFVDGFTRLDTKQAIVPDFLFFGEEVEVDLTEYYDPEAKKAIIKKVNGLFHILNSFKFTVAENTPIEEEIALDPELLGKVFENLLASYNPETKTTARKQTGSFYTPREIVNYMVDESLIEYLKQNTEIKTDDFDSRLRNLFSYNDEGNPFKPKETDELIEAINNAKILDPACGSGAFPMGVLHKMVHLLQKLDPGNIKWKAQQKEKIIGNQIKELEKDKKAISGLSDKAVREKAIIAVEERLKEVEEIFESKNNFDDYARKLYLIENCIYGIDIQPIAVQISKLRFFISLIIDQDKDSKKENLGFRSLPNLETKFVAANTLIGLEKPKLVTGDIFIQDTLNLIKVKSDQLKEIRHNYFNAKLRKEKLQFQAEDKKLRKEISEMLVKIGYTTGNAFNIASFDPYDQNHFANWFEPEWMFGNEVKDGFDIVIGNPPYLNVEKIDETIKSNISKFRTAYQKYDLYVLFYEKAIDLLKQNGQLNYITSNKFLSQGYGLLLRQEFLKFHINQIINFNYDIFEAATVRTCIFHLQKTNSSNRNIKIIDVATQKDSDKFTKLLFNYLDQNIFNETEENNFRINLTNPKIEILSKISRKSIKVEDVCSVNYGLRPSSEKLGKKKEAFIYENNPNKKFKKYFEGKDMGYWKIKAFSYLDYRPDVMYNSMFPELFENDKLVGLRTLSDIGKLRFIYDEEKFYCNDSVVVLTLWHLFSKVKNQTIQRNISLEKIKKSKGYNYYYIQGILNSKLIKFYVNELLYDGTHFYPNHMKSLPIKDVSLDEQSPIITVVDKIHKKLKTDINANVSDLEKQIDSLVYKLYDLSEEEIAIIENSMNKT
jgi:hypothetical protein